MKIAENSKYCQGKSSCLLNDLRNFNNIFTKDVTYNLIKSHKKPAFHPHFRRCIFEKTTDTGQIDPQPF